MNIDRFTSESVQYNDLKRLLFGNMKGTGIYREVFDFAPDKSLVIKCAERDPEINFFEQEIWNMVAKTKIAKWFAPCVDISPNGIFLIQKKVEMKGKESYPKMIPSFFEDTKYSNYGWIGKQFVCCDYSGFFRSSLTHKWNGRLKKAEWWEQE